MASLLGKRYSGIRSVPAQAADDWKMLGFSAKKEKKKVLYIKCEPWMALHDQSTQTMLPRPPSYSSFSECCYFRISFPDWTTKDRNVVCIYRVRAYTKSWCGRMQILAFFYQIMRFGLLWKINQKFKKTTTQDCFSIVKHPLSTVSLTNLYLNAR